MNAKSSFWDLVRQQKKLDRKSYFRLIRTARTFIAVMLSISIAVFIGIAIFSSGGIGAVIGMMASVNPAYVAAAMAAVFGGYMVSFFKWRYYLKVLRIHIPMSTNFAAYMSLYSMELTPGRIGRVVAAYTLKRVSRKKFMGVLPIVSVDIFTDYLGFIVLSLIMGLLFINYLPVILLVDVLLLFPFLFILSPWLFNAIKKHVLRGRFSELLATYGEEYFAAQTKLNNHRVYLVSVLFSLPAAVLNSLSLYLVLLGIGIKAALLPALLVFVVSTVVGILSLVPGTIGTTDVTMLALLVSTFGISTAAAAAVTILTRVATIWFGVLLGTVFLFYTFRFWEDRKRGRKVKRRRTTR